MLDQQVLYIEGTGTQYIETDILSRIPLKCEAEFYINAVNPAILGTAQINDPTSRFFMIGLANIDNQHPDEFYITCRYGNSFWVNTGIRCDDLGKFHITSGVEYTGEGGIKKYISSNGEYYAVTSNTLPSLGLPICILLQRNSSDIFPALIFSVKLTESENLIFNGIPCYRKTDLKAGLYDIVNNKFYPSDGVDDFLYGPEIR